MWGSGIEEQVVNLQSPRERERLRAFLERQGLAMEQDLEYAMILADGGHIAATGSFSGRVLKCIAVGESYGGMGLAAKVMTHLTNEEYLRGRTHLFVFTKPENTAIFSELGMYPIAQVPAKVVLMENRRDGLSRYLDELAGGAGALPPSAAVVVNCNPFTLGHKYLLEYAAARCERLHVFVVWEDRSVFPAQVRYRLVKEGLSHLPNVTVHQGRDYIISGATFPSYFLKRRDEAAEVYARLDTALFAQRIAPRLNIKKRFVGEEPNDPLTALYNDVMAELLPAAGIGLEIVPRKREGDSVISASRVRALLRDGDMGAVRALVPESTYRFLQSPEAGEALRRIRGLPPSGEAVRLSSEGMER